jgi:tRNA G10  N-methylase Trm11
LARGLIRRIYEHMRDSGYITPGDRVIDPFGGIAAGAVDAMSMGLHWYGCELEPRFVALGNANIDKWQRDLAMLGDRVGGAYLLQGDSRYLASLFGGGMGAAVSSPPFGEQQTGGGIGAARRRLIPALRRCSQRHRRGAGRTP